MLSSFSSTFSDLKVSSVRVIIDRDGDLISSVDMVDVVDAVDKRVLLTVSLAFRFC